MSEKQLYAQEASLQRIAFVESIGTDDPFHHEYEGALPWIIGSKAKPKDHRTAKTKRESRTSGRASSAQSGQGDGSEKERPESDKKAVSEVGPSGKDADDERRGCFRRRRGRSKRRSAAEPPPILQHL